MSEPVRLVEERRPDPLRRVEVEHDGRWWPALLRSWRLLDDGRGWLADVEYTVTYDWDLESTSDRCRRTECGFPLANDSEPRRSPRRAGCSRATDG